MLALIVASVPLLTNRIFSMLGIAPQIRREFHFEFGCDSETCAAMRLIRDRIRNGGIRVTQNQRAPRAHVIDVRISVGVPNFRAFAARGNNRDRRPRIETRARDYSRRRQVALRRGETFLWSGCDSNLRALQTIAPHLLRVGEHDARARALNRSKNFKRDALLVDPAI